MSHSEKRPFWRQPLFHFLIIGMAIFAISALRGNPVDPASKKIVVSAAQVERMTALWQKTWGRPPSQSELQALVRDYIKEEIYYREALALGLDNNDTVIRRRLRQKMEFLTTAQVSSSQPSDAALKAYYQKNADKYRQSAIFTFDQVFFKNANAQDISLALKTLNNGGTIKPDTISLPTNLTQADEADIARVFGTDFYTAIQTLPNGTWSGPIRSGFGQHLVKIDEKIPASLPEFERVQKRVEMDYLAYEEKQARDAAYETLRKTYKVEIEMP